MTTVYSIYPSIGIARVGNAPNDYLLTPTSANDVPQMPDGTPLKDPSEFRDSQGRFRRLAAEFRIFRSVNNGPQEEVTLTTPGVVEISWTVHIANKKASWYQFQTIRGEDGYAPNHPLRNPGKIGNTARQPLIIDPGPRTISGINKGGVEFSRSTIPSGYPGTFPPKDLKPLPIDTLGELATDKDGRLRVIGGLGSSGSNMATPIIQQYANNDGWWDDTSDGTVSATIRIANEKQVVVAKDAWVITAPPSYAPQLGNIVTLYDTIFDISVRKQNYSQSIFAEGYWKSGATGYKPHFETDIRPIFERAEHTSWVTAMPSKPHTFDYTKLGDPNVSLNGLRQYYLDFFRGPGEENILINPETGATIMPYMAGDDSLQTSELGAITAPTARYARLTDTQYFFLMQWASGWFASGAAPARQPGEVLTRGVLDNCVGAALSPGIEMGWISRNPLIYEEPFRINKRKLIPQPLSLGYQPLLGMEPGDITRYMACPWQADFNECSAEEIDGRLLWWWPAQRPEFVYENKPAFNAENLGPQVSWIGTEYNQNAPDYIAFPDDLQMVENWNKLGIVYNIGTAEAPHFVEVNRLYPRAPGSQGDTGPDQPIGQPGPEKPR